MNKHFFSLAGGKKIWPPVNPNFLLPNTDKCWSVAVWSECVHPVFCWIVNQTKCKMWPNCEKEKVALALSWLLLPGLCWRGSVLVSVAAICAARCQSPWLSVLYRNKVISAQIRQKPATITTQPRPRLSPRHGGARPQVRGSWPGHPPHNRGQVPHLSRRDTLLTMLLLSTLLMVPSPVSTQWPVRWWSGDNHYCYPAPCLLISPLPSPSSSLQASGSFIQQSWHPPLPTLTPPLPSYRMIVFAVMFYKGSRAMQAPVISI